MQVLSMIFISVLIGVSGAIAAKTFFVITESIGDTLYPFYRTVDLGFVGWRTLSIIIASATIAYIVVIIIRRLNRPSAWYGPPDLILMTHLPDKAPNVKSGILSTLSALVSICGGASVGQYGPLVVFGSTIGIGLGKFFRFSMVHSETLIAAGAASAISAAFSAPIGGIIFAHEVILRHYGFNKFAPVTISSVIAYVVGDFLFGINPLFPVANSGMFDGRAVIALTVTGIMSGFGAVVYVRWLERCAELSGKIESPILKGFICIALITIIGSFAPQVLGLGSASINQMLTGNIYVLTLLVLLLLKIALTGVSLGFGYFGGIFSPALFIGAAIGGIIAQIAIGIEFSGISSTEVLVIAGAGALVAATIGGPLSAIFIVFEMTQNHTIATQVMISVVFSCLVYRRFMEISIFDRALLRRGFDVQIGREEIILAGTAVDTVMETDFPSLDQNKSVKEAKILFEERSINEAFLIDSQGKLVGVITAFAILNQNDNEPLTDIVVEPELVLRSGATILDAISQLSDFIGEGAPIVDKNHILIGVMPEANLLQAYTKAQADVHLGTTK